jgi:hypothetical protein
MKVFFKECDVGMPNGFFRQYSSRSLVFPDVLFVVVSPFVVTVILAY